MTRSASNDPAFLQAFRAVVDGRIAEGERALDALAEAGHAEAAHQWARLQLYDMVPTPDLARAKSRLDGAAAAGSADARYTRALVEAGIGTRWLDDLLAAANDGDVALAWRSLGLLFGRCGGDAQRFARHAFRRAAAAGDGLAAALLRQRLASGESGEDASVPRVDPISIAPHAQACGESGWQVSDGVLGDEECMAMKLLASAQLRPSEAIDPHSGAGQRLRIRTSDDAVIDPLVEDVALVLARRRLCALAGVDARHAEPFVVLRYRPGQEYRLHRDTLPPSLLADPVQGRGGQRVATVIAYLANVEAGGETVFPRRGLSVVPKRGAALAFRNVHADGRVDEDSLHAGQPVARGEKWIATLWLRERPLRGF